MTIIYDRLVDMRILVTGASGRVGKEVVAGLKKKLKEATVVAATRDTTSSSEYLKSLGADEVVRYTYSITLDKFHSSYI